MIKETPDVTEPVEVFGFTTARELVNQTLNKPNISGKHSAYEEPNIPSGFENIDKITKGFKRGELITIATRPGNGKTAFLLSLIHNIAVIQERRVALFSPERTAMKVINRLIESSTSHSIEQIRQGMLKDGDKAHASAQIQRIAESNLFIDESIALDAKEMLLRCHQVKLKHNAEIILVDAPEFYASHLQDPEIRHAESEELFQTLRNLARELDVPVVCFSQMGKPKGTTNGSLLPSLNEMPEYLTTCSATVMFIHRPEYYLGQSDLYPRGTVDMIIDKLNNVEKQEKTQLKFIESIDLFVNPD